MLAAMTRPPSVRFDHLLSSRALIGWGGPLGTQRPVTKEALYEFGGGFPDPMSFPYDGIAEATARLMKSDEAPAALSYGEALGYRGLRGEAAAAVRARRS